MEKQLLEKCTGCNTHIYEGDANLYGSNEQPFCGNCYVRRKRMILKRNQYLKILLVCHECQKTIKDIIYLIDNKRALCELCMIRSL